MHIAYTMPNKPDSFGGARRLFVGTRFDWRVHNVYSNHFNFTVGGVRHIVTAVLGLRTYDTIHL